MTQQYDIKGMAEKIKAIRRETEGLRKIGGDIPTVDRNTVRLLANIKMLEISISDAVDLGD